MAGLMPGRGGRPRKPPDPNYPKRLNTIAEKETPNAGAAENGAGNAGVGEGSAGASAEPIIVSPGEKENAANSPAEGEGDPSPTGAETPTYFCQSCQTPLIFQEARCPGCKERLAW